MGLKDYNAIAAKLKDVRKNALTQREKQLLSVLASEIAGYCQSTNPNFIKHRFFTAAGAFAEGEE